jgi:hypothetical protein
VITQRRKRCASTQQLALTLYCFRYKVISTHFARVSDFPQASLDRMSVLLLRLSETRRVSFPSSPLYPFFPGCLIKSRALCCRPS